MPENIQELYLDGYIWPDKVAVHLQNNEEVDTRRYIPESLYKSMNEANEAWQVENSKLRELVYVMHSELVSCEDNGYICGGHKFDDRMCKLGIKVENK